MRSIFCMHSDDLPPNAGEGATPKRSCAAEHK